MTINISESIAPVAAVEPYTRKNLHHSTNPIKNFLDPKGNATNAEVTAFLNNVLKEFNVLREQLEASAARSHKQLEEAQEILFN